MRCMRQRWADYRVFWRQFRQAYHSTGAVLPSGRGLSRALTRFVRNGEAASATVNMPAVAPSDNASIARRILEVGPGTGAVTVQILHDMRPCDRLVLVERNEHFVAHLSQRLNEFSAANPDRNQVSLVHAGVEELPEHDTYDLIISGLPLNNFTVESVDRILGKFGRLLAPDGILSFFEYVAVRRAKSLVSSQVERERLRGIARTLGHFLRTEIRRDLVMANLPPAWVHHIRFGQAPTECPP